MDSLPCILHVSKPKYGTEAPILVPLGTFHIDSHADISAMIRKGVADEQLAKLELERDRGRKRNRQR